jgi:hypothetical protein
MLYLCTVRSYTTSIIAAVFVFMGHGDYCNELGEDVGIHLWLEVSA